ISPMVSVSIRNASLIPYIVPAWYSENVPNRSLRGIVTALVTPFKSDERIDYGAWQILIDAQINAGVDGVFAGGSQGEFFSLDEEERLVAMRFCRQATADRVLLFANV